jgi:hypothetical protein
MTGSTVETYMTVILSPLFGAEHGIGELSMNRHIFRTTENVNVQAKLQNFKRREVRPAIDQLYPGYCLSQLLSVQ